MKKNLSSSREETLQANARVTFQESRSKGDSPLIAANKARAAYLTKGGQSSSFLKRLHQMGTSDKAEKAKKALSALSSLEKMVSDLWDEEDAAIEEEEDDASSVAAEALDDAEDEGLFDDEAAGLALVSYVLEGGSDPETIALLQVKLGVGVTGEIDDDTNERLLELGIPPLE